MGLYNNVPTFTYVSATGITVTYNKKVYTVQSFYTNKKYIYWDSDNGTVLQASNTMPTRSTKTHLVLINDNGIVTTVPSTSENFEISYDGDSDDAIKSRIYALYKKDKELGDKYVAIEQDVDGIKQLVGTSDGENGTIIDRVSKIEQRADKLELSVSDIQTTYKDDKEFEKVREDLTAAIIELNADLGVFNSELQDYYRNSEISSEETIAIETGLEQLTLSKQNVLANLEIIKGYIEISDIPTLNNATTEFNNAHIFLEQNVKVAISDSVIIPTEKTIIIDAISKYNLQINQLKNTCDELILLGLGGVITEKLGQISMTSNEIKLSVSTVDTKVDNQRTEFEENFNDVNNRLNSLDMVDKKYAEIILGDDGIQSIVKHIKGDYASKSLLEQTVDSFRFSFSESGGYNKLYNSGFKNGTSEWSLLSWNDCGGTGGTAGLRTYSAGEEWGLANRNTLAAYVYNITNTSATTDTMGVGFDSNRIWGGRDWTFQCLLAAHRAKSISIEILEFDSNGTRLSPIQAFAVSNPPSGGNNRNNWHKFHCTFSLKHSNCAWFIVRVFMNEWTGTSNSAYIWIAEPIVVLGHKSDIIYTPSSEELYSGVTTIDKDGVRVNSYNSNVNTVMNSNGFYVQQNGSNILQADGNGINLNQGHVALNKWGLWVNSPNSNTSTAIDSNGFYVNQNGHQILKVDGGGVSLNQGQVALNQNGLWVNSPNTHTSTAIDANGFYIKQGNTYPLRADGDGVTIGQGRVLVNKWGVQVYHDDGSYSQMDGGGFFNYVNGSGNRYHHLMTMGEYECYSEETKRIWLPVEFRNKPFRVVTSIKRVKASYDLYTYKAPLLSFYAHADTINHSEGWIDIYASVRGWNYNMGSSKGDVIGDESADNTILKPIVAYWVIV